MSTMSLSSRLRKKKGLVRSPFQVRPSVSPETVIDLLPQIAKEIVKARMLIMEGEFNAFKKAKLNELEAFVEDVEKEVSSAIAEHIRTRAVEIKGHQGERGETGAQGIQGERGLIGPKGDVGAQGIQGERGNDGSPDTPDQVVDKVNEAKTLVAFNKIAGLDEWVRKIQQISREKRGGGGGGMSTPQHESFPMNGSDTSITLASNVAAGGNAIWVRYQGQSLDMDTHFTVSDKTVSFTFTPDDGSTISITYFRT